MVCINVNDGIKMAKNIETSDRDKISFFKKFIYGLGAFVNNLLGAAMNSKPVGH